MSVAQRTAPATFAQMAIQERYRFVELRDGVLVERRPVSFGHARTFERFARELRPQIDPDDDLVFVETSRLRVGASYFIPDLVAVDRRL